MSIPWRMVSDQMMWDRDLIAQINHHAARLSPGSPPPLREECQARICLDFMHGFMDPDRRDRDTRHTGLNPGIHEHLTTGPSRRSWETNLGTLGHAIKNFEMSKEEWMIVADFCNKACHRSVAASGVFAAAVRLRAKRYGKMTTAFAIHSNQIYWQQANKCIYGVDEPAANCNVCFYDGHMQHREKLYETVMEDLMQQIR